MPVHDPTPSPTRSMVRRFWRIFRLLALLALVIAAIAMLLVARGDPTLHINMLIATGLGTLLTVLLGTALMTLIFLSASSGHDEAASHLDQENDQE